MCYDATIKGIMCREEGSGENREDRELFRWNTTLRYPEFPGKSESLMIEEGSTLA